MQPEAFPHELAAALDKGKLDAYLELRDQAEITADIQALTKYQTPIQVTLRDYFAAKVMQSMAATPAVWKFSEIPDRAYKLADDMLEARKAHD